MSQFDKSREETDRAIAYWRSSGSSKGDSQAFRYAHKALLTERGHVDALLEILKEIINCPMGIDPATVPKAGIDAAPEQVVLNASIGLMRIQKARALLAKLDIDPWMGEKSPNDNDSV